MLEPYFDRSNPNLYDLRSPEHRRILEVGCGAAALGRRWKESDPTLEVWGIDQNKEALHIAAGRLDRVLDIDLDRFCGLPSGSGYFDLITFGDVLEHLRDPSRVLSLFARSLSPAGEILACVPNVGHWSVVTGLLQGRFDYTNDGLLDRTHVHTFTPATFRELLEGSGLGAVTLFERIAVSSPVSQILGQLGATCGQDLSRAGTFEEDLNTYQAVFRARPPLIGPMVGFVVVVADPGEVSLAVTAKREFMSGFRAGEPVRLLVARLANDVDPLPAGGPGSSGLDRPPVDEVVVDPSRDLVSQLVMAPECLVAVGEGASAALPGSPRCDPDRVSMLEAALSGSLGRGLVNSTLALSE